MTTQPVSAPLPSLEELQVQKAVAEWEGRELSLVPSDQNAFFRAIHVLAGYMIDDIRRLQGKGESVLGLVERSIQQLNTVGVELSTPGNEDILRKIDDDISGLRTDFHFPPEGELLGCLRPGAEYDLQAETMARYFADSRKPMGEIVRGLDLILPSGPLGIFRAVLLADVVKDCATPVTSQEALNRHRQTVTAAGDLLASMGF